MSRSTFTGAATDYLPKPDNDPAPVAEPTEPTGFRVLVPLTEAEASAARLAHATWQRNRLLEEPEPVAPPVAPTTAVKP
ncbi:MAG: hypothetical protein ACREO4_06380 [Lysobacter sp.]